MQIILAVVFGGNGWSDDELRYSTAGANGS